ncbi:hypothetical protein [Listeria costaricensis]|uniref:hypothetical protein n=1 Tax=Listeria costaricensis TaxID=2026604 RepID=UPI000C07C6E6|nr:hypothetical protein [Listeria costaricensis]
MQPRRTWSEVPKVMIEGLEFEVVPRAFIDEILNELSDEVPEIGFGYQEEGQYFLVACENAHLEKLYLTPDLPVLETIGGSDLFVGFVFLKDLHIDEYLEAYDTDFSPSLTVFGDLKVRQAFLGGNSFYVHGDLTAFIVYGEYNHGMLYVNGILHAKAIIMQDMACFASRIEAEILYDTDEIETIDLVRGENGELQKVKNFYMSTHELKDFLADGIETVRLWGQDYPDSVTASRLHLLLNDEPTNYPGFADHIAERFDAIFALDVLQAETDGEVRLEIEDGRGNDCIFTKYMFEGEQYRLVSVTSRVEKRMIYHAVGKDVYRGCLIYKNRETGEETSSFSIEMTDDTLQARMVKHAFGVAEAGIFRYADVITREINADTPFELRPGSGAGQLEFGWSSEQVEELIGFAEEKWEESMDKFEKRSGVAFKYRFGELDSLTFDVRMKNVTYQGVAVFEVPRKQVVELLKEADSGPRMKDGKLIFKKLGIEITGVAAEKIEGIRLFSH